MRIYYKITHAVVHHMHVYNVLYRTELLSIPCDVTKLNRMQPKIP